MHTFISEIKVAVIKYRYFFALFFEKPIENGLQIGYNVTNEINHDSGLKGKQYGKI